MTSSPRLLMALPIATQVHGDDPRRIVEITRLAEAAGVDGVVLPDHVVIGPRTDRYPWGTFPFPNDAPWLEPLTLLTAIATATERVKLTTGILIVPLRPAVLLAKTVATIDVLSGGRVELGVGTGWQEEEFTSAGIDYTRRGQLLTDYVAACRALWTDSPAKFSSDSVSFDELWCEPKPVRPGGPPVLFSGTLTARNRRRIVELGDGWIPIMGESEQGIAAGVEELRAAYEDAGRDPATLLVRTRLPAARGSDGERSLAATLEGADALAAIGVTDVIIGLMEFVRDEAEFPAFFDRLAEARR